MVQKVDTFHGVDEVLTLGVDGDAKVRDDNVHCFARRGNGGAFGPHGRNAALQQRYDDDGALGPCRCIWMPALGACNHAA